MDKLTKFNELKKSINLEQIAKDREKRIRIAKDLIQNHLNIGKNAVHN